MKYYFSEYELYILIIFLRELYICND